jgi:hypothetical protein
MALRRQVRPRSNRSAHLGNLSTQGDRGSNLDAPSQRPLVIWVEQQSIFHLQYLADIALVGRNDRPPER